MAILNVTPDSFSDGGRFFDPPAAVAHARRMIAEGADLIDIGGESTRPGAERLSAEEELKRVLPVIEALRSDSDVAISIDSWKAGVAREAIAAGADMINDIGGLRLDAAMAELAAETGAAVAIMHMQGTPQTMQKDPTYDDVVEDIKIFLRESIERALAAGVDRDSILIDPGIGFGKTLEHNLEILRRLREFSDLGVAVLIGTSRKSFLGKILDVRAEKRMIGTMATVALAVREGASVVRVHDVREAVETVRVADAICRQGS
ncbi:MAG: dihydropteroate synthase [Planctomycetes bacterium]|nr:dihydropteroate synthase [Planctomycetota bacterium]